MTKCGWEVEVLIAVVLYCTGNSALASVSGVDREAIYKTYRQAVEIVERESGIELNDVHLHIVDKMEMPGAVASYDPGLKVVRLYHRSPLHPFTLADHGSAFSNTVLRTFVHELFHAVDDKKYRLGEKTFVDIEQEDRTMPGRFAKRLEEMRRLLVLIEGHAEYNTLTTCAKYQCLANPVSAVASRRSPRNAGLTRKHWMARSRSWLKYTQSARFFQRFYTKKNAPALIGDVFHSPPRTTIIVNPELYGMDDENEEQEILAIDKLLVGYLAGIDYGQFLHWKNSIVPVEWQFRMSEFGITDHEWVKDIVRSRRATSAFPGNFITISIIDFLSEQSASQFVRTVALLDRGEARLTPFPNNTVYSVNRHDLKRSSDGKATHVSGASERTFSEDNKYCQFAGGELMSFGKHSDPERMKKVEIKSKSRWRRFHYATVASGKRVFNVTTCNVPGVDEKKLLASAKAVLDIQLTHRD